MDSVIFDHVDLDFFAAVTIQIITSWVYLSLETSSDENIIGIAEVSIIARNDSWLKNRYLLGCDTARAKECKRSDLGAYEHAPPKRLHLGYHKKLLFNNNNSIKSYNI